MKVIRLDGDRLKVFVITNKRDNIIYVDWLNMKDCYEFMWS